jgi:hypothetical protein
VENSIQTIFPLSPSKDLNPHYDVYSGHYYKKSCIKKLYKKVGKNNCLEDDNWRDYPGVIPCSVLLKIGL